MQQMYRIRDRYAAPTIAALLLATLAVNPLQSLLAPQILGHGAQPGLIHPALLAALFVWLLVPLQLAWQRWLACRPSLIVLPGGRKLPSATSTQGEDSGAAG